MKNVLKINFGKRKRLTSLLGLTLDGSRLEGVVLRRTNGSLQLHQTFSVSAVAGSVDGGAGTGRA